MSVRYDKCPLCDEPTPTWAEWDWHRQVEHDRDWDPCVICGEWDERTEESEFGDAHEGCANQVALDQAMRHYERWLEGLGDTA